MWIAPRRSSHEIQMQYPILNVRLSHFRDIKNWVLHVYFMRTAPRCNSHEIQIQYPLSKSTATRFQFKWLRFGSQLKTKINSSLVQVRFVKYGSASIFEIVNSAKCCQLIFWWAKFVRISPFRDIKNWVLNLYLIWIAPRRNSHEIPNAIPNS